MTPSIHTVTSEADWARVIPLIWEAAAGRKVWLLRGELGSGKTTLTRYLIEFLGGDLEVSSPTFSLVNLYEWEDESQLYQLYHLDLYRLESTDDVINIGFEEILDHETLTLIEWPDLAIPLLPEDCFELELRHDDGSRKVLVL